MLSPYRVLDLTDSRAALGPMILADLGADVIKVEPPGGSRDREAAPLDPALPPGRRSLRLQAYDRNKRSVTLDLDAEDARAIFFKLVATADFLFENAPPGAMTARGLGFADLCGVNPRLVYVAISPFGQDGPYAGHAATDLTLAAMGGMVALNGDPDRPPVRVTVPQAWLHAAAESATAALVAHHRRLQTGAAQLVDVAVQPAVFWTTLNASIAAAVQGTDIERQGTKIQLGTITQRVMFRCSDGYTVITVNPASLQLLIPWLVADGVAAESWLVDEEWPSYMRRVVAGEPVTHTYPELLSAIERLVATYSRQELYRRGLQAGVFLAPANRVPDILADDQLAARGYWQILEHPVAPLRAPGPFARFSRTPIRYRHGVPAPGEHNGEILSSLAQPDVPA